MTDLPKINLSKHPAYMGVADMLKWRLAYGGGRQFVDTYLRRYSSREDLPDFAARKEITYVPRFAKSNLNEVKDAIYQRMPEIARVGGPISFQSAITGVDGGVDKLGNSMNSFIGTTVLLELVLMGRVGIFVDMPEFVGETLANAVQRPYLYAYTREQIENWVPDKDVPGEYQAVQLCDEVFEFDEDGFPLGTTTRYRRVRKTSQGIVVQLVDAAGEQIGDTKTIGMGKIPFVCGEISESLMADLADYQIALMNLSSSDLMYLLKANFPFYVEQVDGKSVNRFLQQEEEGEEGETVSKNVKVGVVHGRQYTGDKEPNFIHPSAEPLKASMEKQEQMKQEMRQLLKLKIAQTTSVRVSKDSKEMDERTLENGLSAIGLELERMERLVGEIWGGYTGENPPEIHYPTSYNLKTDAERRTEAQELEELKGAIPSVTYAKELSKKQAATLLGNSLKLDVLEKINAEIDSAPGGTSNSEQICRQVEAGICDPDTGATLLGYPTGTAEKAAKAQERKAKAIAEAQADANPEPNGAQNRDAEKDPATNKQGQGNRQRGPAKK